MLYKRDTGSLFLVSLYIHRHQVTFLMNLHPSSPTGINSDRRLYDAASPGSDVQTLQAVVPPIHNPDFFRGALNVNANSRVFNQEQNACIDKLPRAQSAGYRSGNHKTCLEGTRTVVLQDIESWEAEDRVNFVHWLKGVAGCGKSTVAQTFAERSAEKGRLIASFFCSRDFPDRSNLRLIFPTLAHDLAHQDVVYKTALAEILQSSPDLEHESLPFQFEKFIVRPLKSTGLSALLVIDGLDECKDKEPVSQILSVLAKFVEHIPNIKILITGRPEDHIRLGFAIPSLRTKELPLHDVDSATVDADIRLYVKTRLEEIVARRCQRLDGRWPSDSDIDAITKRAAGLFIVAYIITAFVDCSYDMPQNRLDLISRMPNSAFCAGKATIYAAYRQVLVASFQDAEADNSNFFEQLRLVVGSIVLALKPLSRASLAMILGLSSGQIWMILSRLHSVLIVPDADTQPIRICHKSLVDFLTNRELCSDTRFLINVPAHHSKFAIRCLRLATMTLKRNMCCLPQYAMNNDIGDLRARRDQYIGDALAYSCECWASHLRSSIGATSDADIVIDPIIRFFETHFLSWLEVLSVEDNFRAAISSLQDVKYWLSYVNPAMGSLELIEDCERFVLRFFDVMEESATHIYHSALPWSPSSSIVRAVYQTQLQMEAKLLNAADSWGACIRTIKTHDLAYDIAISHKGTLIAVVGRNSMKVFDTVTGACLNTFERRPTRCLSFSPDDNFLVSGLEDKSVVIFDMETGSLIQRFVGHTGEVYSVAFSPCGDMVASGAENIRIWNTVLGCCECVLEGHGNRVEAVCWSITGNKLASASLDSTVRIWDVSTKTCLKIFHPRSGLGSATFFPSLRDTFLVAVRSTDGREVTVYDSQSDNVTQTLLSSGLTIQSIQFSDNGDKVMCQAWDAAFIWDLVSDRRVSTVKCAGLPATLSPDGTLVVSGDGHFVKVWIADHENLNSGADDSHSMAAKAEDMWFSSDGQLLTSRSKIRFLRTWNATTGEYLFTFRLAFPVDMSLGTCLHYFKSGTKFEVLSYRRYNLARRCNALSPDGRQLVSMSTLYSDITLFDLASQRQISHVTFENNPHISGLNSCCVEFSADGTCVFVRCDVIKMGWYIFPKNPADVESASLPMTFKFVPMTQGEWLTKEDSPLPAQGHQYDWEMDSCWILDHSGRRIFWVPPDRKHSELIAFHGKKVAIEHKNGVVDIVDFSDVLL